MIELAAAAALLGTVFVVTIPLLGHIRVARDSAQQRFIAQQEAANIMERLAIHVLSNSPNETTTVSPEAAALLLDADVAVTREPTDDGTVRVTVSVSWRNEAGEHSAPAVLTAWFPVTEDAP